MKKRIIPIGFLLWTVLAVEWLRGHGVLGQVVQHHIIVTAGEFHIDVTVELTFHSVFAQRERQRLDTNRDGFIEAKEVEQYLAGILAKLEPGLRMETRQREIDLIRLHPPELDLLGNEESGAHPLRVSAFYLARLDRGLRKAGVVDLEDRLWMETPALCSLELRSQGRTGRVGPRVSSLFGPGIKRRLSVKLFPLSASAPE